MENKDYSKTENTQIRKGFYGWVGETTLNINGLNLRVSTMKRSNGKISSSVTEVQPTDVGFIWSPFDKHFNKTLIVVEGIATEKNIKETHYKALAILDQMKENGELPSEKKELQRGQIVSYGDQANERKKYVVTGKKQTYGIQCLGVDLKRETSTSLSTCEGLGGWQVENDEPWTNEQVTNHEIVFFEARKKEQEERDAEKILREQVTKAKIDIGASILPSIPKGVTKVIIAELIKDESDSQTDYYATSTQKTIFLAWSRLEKNDFREMRLAALNCEDTEHLNSDDTKLEHRENYSGGSGYYLGENKWYGWQVRKVSVQNEGQKYGIALENIQIAIAEDRYFIPTKEQVVEAVCLGSNEQVTVRENVEKGGVEVLFNSKPDESVLNALKNNGFRWSRFSKLWYNKLTPENLEFANSLVKNN